MNQKYSYPREQVASSAQMYKPAHGGYPDFFSKKPGITYSINLLWLNASLHAENSFLAPNDLFMSIVSSAIRWAKGNPSAQINIWYYSPMLSDDSSQLNNSIEFLQKQSPKDLKIAFKDICSIRDKNCTAIQEKYLIPQTELFFSIDVLKLMITLHRIYAKSDKYTVFSDIDVVPLSEEMLFDNRTLAQLDLSGFVVAASAPFENSFQITANTKPAQRALEAFFCHVDLWREKALDCGISEPQQIYNMYPYLLGIFLRHTGLYDELVSNLPWDRRFQLETQQEYYSQYFTDIALKRKDGSTIHYNIRDFTKAVEMPMSQFKISTNNTKLEPSINWALSAIKL